MDMYFQLFMKPNWRRTFLLQDAERATSFVNFYNGRKDLYRTIYNFVREPSAMNAIIDKVFIDLDPGEDKDTTLEDARKLVSYLDEEGLKRKVFFSGRGMHVYIYVQPLLAESMKNPGNAIKQYVNILVDKLGITPDWQVVGDLSRISRLPNTMNLKTKLFCIPLRDEDLKMSKEEIMDLAQNQYRPSVYVTDEEGDLLNLREYDTEELFDVPQIEPIENSNISINNSSLPLCVEESLKRGNPGYRERYAIITALRDLAYSREDVIGILEQYLTPEKFIHCVEQEQQVDYLFNKHSLVFPKCETIKLDGLCVKGCPGQRIYHW
jgi:hypothetical protein